MAVTIYNTVQSASLAESPIVVRVDDTAAAIASSSYQFVADLYSWRGDESDKPSTPTYTFSKFPVVNSLGNGSALFDFSPYLNSQLSASLAFQYTYHVGYQRWYEIEMYSKWVDGGVEYTSSHQNVNGGIPSLVQQGYNIWGERNDSVNNLNKELSGDEAFSASIDNFPILSTIPADVTMSLYRTDVPYFWATYNRKDAPSGDVSTMPQIDSVIAQSSGIDSVTYDVFSFYQTGSFGAITYWEVSPDDFSSSFDGYSEMYLQAQDSVPTPFGPRITLSLGNCDTKYTPVRIAFKNRYGAFDQFDFPLVSRTTFNAQTKQYKTPSISSTLPRYDRYRYNETYYSEGGEILTVNTGYVDERLNEFFKGMLVSDEIYQVEPSTTNSGINADLTPLVISSTSTQLKTSEVDKLIQYTFTFQVGTPYKLVL